MKTAAGMGGAFAGALALLAASTAQAQGEDASSDVTIFGWAVSGRISAQYAPDYLGAKTYSLGPTGSLQFHRPGARSRFAAPDESAGLQLLGGDTLSAGVVVGARSGRDDNKNLVGVHKIHFALEPGVYLEWWPADGLRLRSEARRGVTGNQAWSGDISADLVSNQPKWLLSVGPRLHLADSRFTQTYFDIDAADAARSPFGITPYAASGAFVSVGGLASAEFRWTRRLSLLADVSYDHLQGDAAKSPIVARIGSPNQYRGAVGVRYRFGR